MSCGLPCWNCADVIPPERHRLNAMERVFCSSACQDGFGKWLTAAPTGLCSAHQHGEDPFCRTCYPEADGG